MYFNLYRVDSTIKNTELVRETPAGSVKTGVASGVCISLALYYHGHQSAGTLPELWEVLNPMSIPIRDRSQVWFLIKESFGFSPRVNLHSLFLSTFSIATFSTLYPSTTSIRHISPTVGPPSVQVHSNSQKKIMVGDNITLTRSSIRDIAVEAESCCCHMVELDWPSVHHSQLTSQRALGAAWGIGNSK